MRIAFFTDTYIPNTDGVVSSILNYRNELEARGHEVFIFSPGTKRQKKENNDDHVHYFTSASFKPYPDYRIALFNFFSPVKLVKEKNIEIVHAHGIATTGLAAIETSKKLNLPRIASFHTLVPDAVHYLTREQRLQGFLENVAWKYLEWYYANFHRILVPTRYVEKLLTAHSIPKVEVLCNGISLQTFNGQAKPAAVRKAFGLKADTPVVLHVGRVVKEKNLETLIEAAPAVLNLLPETRFLIVGSGPGETHYKDLVRKKDLSDHFIFTGKVPQDLLLSSYSAADVLAFPSLFDTQGLVVLEAMAMGVPSVVQKETAPAEFIESGQSGYLFADRFDFPEKILQAIKNKSKLQPALRERVRQYTIQKSVDRLLELYAGLKR